MACPDYDHLYKVLLIGDSGVGKSNMLLRYADDVYKEDYGATIGVDFKIVTRTIDEKAVKLTIWDTAGQERFRTITCSYYRGAHGIIVVYDVTDRVSFKNATSWMQEIEKYAKPGTRRLLVGNKCDMVSKRVVSREEGQLRAEELGVPFVETSARTAHQIEEAFELLARDIKAHVNPQQLQPRPPSGSAGGGGAQPSSGLGKSFMLGTGGLGLVAQPRPRHVPRPPGGLPLPRHRPQRN